MAGLTFVQKQILNDISKYEPAWRGFGNINQGFGNLMDQTLNRITAVEAASSGSFLEFNISFNSPNEIILLEGGFETFISEVILKIIEPFNSLSDISIGTTANEELLLSILESDLNEVIEYISFPKLSTSDQIKSFLNTAGSSQGQAKVIIKF